MILDRQQALARPAPPEEGVGSANENNVVVREPLHTDEWTDEDRARWRDAHRPWWEPAPR